MKISDDYYQEANTSINEMVEEFDNELVKFKILADSILEENQFGVNSQIAIKSINDDIYSFMSGKLRELTANMVNTTENYITTINNDDKY